MNPIRSRLARDDVQYALVAVLSVATLLAAGLPGIPFEFGLLEATGVVAYAWSAFLLAKNKPLGWWVGLVGVSVYAVIFVQVQLYAEVGLQAFYFLTSLQAIWIWLRGGPRKAERPVTSIPVRHALLTVVVGVAALVGLRELLIALRGAAPFWDALTTVLSLAAHVWLMGRYTQSWYLWIAADAIYVPLYASRGLTATAIMYGLFLANALYGLYTFRRAEAARSRSADEDDARREDAPIEVEAPA